MASNTFLQRSMFSPIGGRYARPGKMAMEGAAVLGRRFRQRRQFGLSSGGEPAGDLNPAAASVSCWRHYSLLEHLSSRFLDTKSDAWTEIYLPQPNLYPL